MKVLLIEDVDSLGYAGEVKRVADGYGRNYLIPLNLAVLATSGALKQAETIRKSAEKRRARETEDARAIANQLTGLALSFERRAGETGKLYGSVTSADIAEAIHQETGIELDKRKIALSEPLRSLGEQEVPVKLMIDVVASVKVNVFPEGGMAVRAPKAPAKEEAEAAAEEVVEEVEEVEEEAAPAEAAAEEVVVEAEAEVEEEEADTKE